MDEASEFVELYNPTDSNVNLDGWTLAEESGNSTTFTSNDTIPARGYYLIGFASGTKDDASWPDADVTADWSLANTGEYVALMDGSSTMIDNFAYGSDDQYGEGDGFVSGSGTNGSPAQGKSAERKSASAHDSTRGNGYDTDNNNNDFFEQATPNPQNSDYTETPEGEYKSPGKLISSIFDAGIAVSWENIEWATSEPTVTEENIDNVGSEPDSLIDDTSDNGVITSGSLTDTRERTVPTRKSASKTLLSQQKTPTMRTRRR